VRYLQNISMLRKMRLPSLDLLRSAVLDRTACCPRLNVFESTHMIPELGDTTDDVYSMLACG